MVIVRTDLWEPVEFYGPPDRHQKAMHFVLRPAIKCIRHAAGKELILYIPLLKLDEDLLSPGSEVFDDQANGSGRVVCLGQGSNCQLDIVADAAASKTSAIDAS